MEFFLLILLAIVLFSVYWYIRHKRSTSPPSSHPNSGQVIVMVVDSLMDQPLRKAVKEDHVPALKFFMDKGHYFPEVVSAYPTMSMTIDTTLLTGTYPDEHSIPGLVWYDEKNHHLISYGSARKEIMMLGVRNVLESAIYDLNNKHISSKVSTIHEDLSQMNHKSASINALVYRGSETKQLRSPKYITLFNFLPPVIKTKGTSFFSYGALARMNPYNRYKHVWQFSGFNDKFSVAELLYLIKNNTLPKFTIAYLPSNDKKVHKKGPMTTAGIKKFDLELQKVLNAYQSWDEALQNNTWVIMGDSGQAPIGKQKDNLIHLPSLLSTYKIPKLSTYVETDAQIVLALNERMAYVYVLDKNIQLSSVADQLKTDERIGFAAWRDGEDIKAVCSEREESLTFRRGGKYKDKYGQAWDWHGVPEVLDVTVEDKHIEFGKYPDAFARLTGSLYSHKGRFIIVDANPGFEFAVEGSPTHKGGASHGSLHEQDSLIPMIVTGTDSLPESMRIVDLKKWFMQLLNE
ncbi:alkaline phosphatase family protein [Halobacillus sp. A5]|uniref:alkaline phosphatase family protein n=1 Tax=Halobacillus sp. A5 TaxID=2880263 RepID=UPI0020A6C9D3|nr:alkaline phosphatase family protein [Halobacillus sp. A5]MCP3027742.1 alkaline phosphatase family protein [Halobacillus sp. A5]